MRATSTETGERLVVGDRQVGEDLAVDLDASQSQALDEPVVRHAVRAGGGVDPGDPQLPEVTLAVPAVPVRVLHRVQHLLFGLAVEPRALAAVTAGGLQDGAALLLGVHSPLDACHGCYSSSRTGRVYRAGRSGVLKVVARLSGRAAS